MQTAPFVSSWRDLAHARPPSAHHRFRLAADHLRIGMFVAELDRPWSDTPFLLQGFLVDSAIELSTLRKYCRHVFVDLELSNPEVLEAIRARGHFIDDENPRPPAALLGDGEADDGEAAAATTLSDAGPTPSPRDPSAPPLIPPRTDVRGTAGPETLRGGPGAAAPSGAIELAAASGSTEPTASGATEAAMPDRREAERRTYRARADVRISSDTRQRFRQLVRRAPPGAGAAAPASLAQRALDRLRNLLASDGAGSPDASLEQHRAFQTELAAALGGGHRLRTWIDRHSAAQEMPRAVQVMAHAERALAALVGNVRAGRVVRIEPIQEAVGRMVDSIVDNPDALLWLAQLRNQQPQAAPSAVRVALFMLAFGRQLGFPRGPLGHLGTIGLLADIGKTRLPRALLEKPGLLNPAEYSIVKEHVRLGLELLSQAGKLPAEVIQGIAQHHERIDGGGYPKGLKGAEIGPYGRITAIADSFAALTTARAYANPLAPQDALMSLYQWSGDSFHAPLVEQFVQAIGVFPVGGLVELSTGEVGVVLAHNRLRPLEPQVLLLAGPDKRPLPVPVERDLRAGAEPDAPARSRIVRGLPSGAYGLALRDFYADPVSATTPPAEAPAAR